MAAVLTERRFDEPGWIVERKLDGIRCLGFRRSDRLRLLSRNALPQNYPAIEAELRAQPSRDFICDGEAVGFRGRETGFKYARDTGARIVYFIFDILRLDGYDVTALPLLERKRLLRRQFRFGKVVRYVEPLKEGGIAAYERACSEGWEGVIVKRADAPYQHRRSPDWLKWKCEASQELVVGGFTDPQGSRVGLGALLVGYYQDGEFVYAGKVGTGFDSKLLRSLRAELERIEIDSPAFTRAVGLPRKGAHWVSPELVVQVAFTEWTDDAKLRHPRFLGVREDRSPREVVREA